MVIDTRSDEISNGTRAALFWNAYESAEVRLVKSHFESTLLLVDLGASLGVVTSAAARLLPARAQVVCVEPNHKILELAQSNVRRNAPQVMVRAVHGAIDYSRVQGSTVTFSRGITHVASALATEPTEGDFEAPVETLRELVGRDVPFSLIVDIEGAEVGLFLKEEAVLRRCEQLLVELHETNYGGRQWHVADIMQLITEQGFTATASYGNVHIFAGPHSSFPA